MRTQISLKLFVIGIFLVMTLLLVTGYSLLSIHFFRMGADSITAATMEEVARSYIESVPVGERGLLDFYRGYGIARKWEHLPKEVRHAFDVPPPKHKKFMIRREHSDPAHRPDILTFIFQYETDGEVLYVGRQLLRPHGPTLLGERTAQSQNLLFAVSGLIAAILALSIFFLFRRIARPVAALETWTRSLGPDTLDQTPPDFSYPELNRMAELVRTSLVSVQESLEREHRFLRHASHELRTPIATIRNNIELFSKMENRPDAERFRDRQLKILARIDRAGLNMHHLTETLLWLYREEVETLPAKEFDLGGLVRQSVEDMRYLLDRKEIELRVETGTHTVSLPEVPARIVIGNLVRNAFQHAMEGEISIRQQGSGVTISNQHSEMEGGGENLGFGFGLQLVLQLTRKLGWRYEAGQEQGRYKVSVGFDGESRG